MGSETAQVRGPISPTGLQILTDRARSNELRDEYAAMGVVQVDDFIETDWLLWFSEEILRVLAPFGKQMRKKHVLVGGEVNPALATGFRFSCIDPARIQETEERAALQTQFEDLGFSALGAQLGQQLSPWVRHIIGRSMEYKKIYCFLYEEGDYISPHNDAQTGDRVNVQFPIPIATTTAFRALGPDGVFRLYYDNPGCLRILGPTVWHEVLPVLRQDFAIDPKRLLLSLRFSN